MRSYLGEYLMPGTEPAKATILVFDKEIHVGYQDIHDRPITLKWHTRDIDVVFNTASGATRIKNRNERNSAIVIDGDEAAAYIKAMQTEQQRPWYQKGKAKEWRRNLLLLSGILGSLVILYFLIVPWLAGLMASNVSVKTEEQFGEAVYNALAPGLEKDSMATRVVNDFFNAMHVSTAYDVRIIVVHSEVVNAFALPGGRIVVFSALLDQMESYPELAALLSHEFTHVNNKHSTKSIFRKLGSKIFIGLLFGRFGNVAAVLADHADNLKSLKYSRGLEKEADLNGLAMLQERKIDPGGFEDLFIHLKKSYSSNELPDFLASHPDIDKRIAYIREAAGNGANEENTELKTIFEQLKQP